MQRARLAIVFALLLYFVASQRAWSAFVDIAPSKDNTLIQQTDPDGQRSNGLGDIVVGRTNQDGPDPPTISIRRGLIAFDVAAHVPAGAIITGVELIMREVTGLNGDRTVELRRLLEDWGEGTSFQNGGQGAPATNGDATWLYTFFNTATPAASPAWSTLGGSFSPTVSSSVIISDDLGGGQMFSWSSTTNSQVAADVQHWLDNPSTNFGWLLSGDESQGQTVKRFNSGESTASPNVPPVLTVHFVVAEPSGFALGTVAVIAFALTGFLRRRKHR